MTIQEKIETVITLLPIDWRNRHEKQAALKNALEIVEAAKAKFPWKAYYDEPMEKAMTKILKWFVEQFGR